MHSPYRPGTSNVYSEEKKKKIKWGVDLAIFLVTMTFAAEENDTTSDKLVMSSVLQKR